MENKDLEDLRRARQLLESPRFVARLASVVGKPIEQLTGALPARLAATMTTAVERSLQVSLDVAIKSLQGREVVASNARHKLAVAATGAFGGAFGLATFALELPASTTLMLRSIADIARSEGELLDAPEARLACLQVFALGGPDASDDAAETGYFAVRAAMARALSEAAEFIAERGVGSHGAPVLVRLVSMIAGRFGVPVSEKFLAQSVPIVGAAGGAAINVLFLDYFQDLARGHFIVRRLERAYGRDAVREAYSRVCSSGGFERGSSRSSACRGTSTRGFAGRS